ncbi:hypothetical protein PHMEG_0005427 [Phytophthora megakarya]|uniref:Uncharacterized protein n=1 Tax=Phytophthora megakarya TaxID=4795 RepID=A0A225WRC2_9STRA|nr:hypothetical protein PHMEG_0005427 [Phytophthora megakarya]
MHGQPKAKMVPHLIRCPQVPNDVRLEWLKAPSDTKHPPISTHSSSAPVPASETESGAAENVEMADPPAPVRPPERPGSYPQSHSQHLEVLRIKANVAKFKAKAMEAKYQAMAMEAEFMAEKMAARVKLQGMGIPEVEIDQLIE